MDNRSGLSLFNTSFKTQTEILLVKNNTENVIASSFHKLNISPCISDFVESKKWLKFSTNRSTVCTVKN